MKLSKFSKDVRQAIQDLSCVQDVKKTLKDFDALQKKSKENIPSGHYCYTVKKGKTIDCPYYMMIKSRPYRLNGFCLYLEKGDLELSKERMKHNWEIIRHKNGKQKTRDMTKEEKSMEAKSGGMSLLWDQVKECRINTI